MLLPILVSAFTAACAATSQSATAPSPDSQKRQPQVIMARTNSPAQVQVQMIRDGKKVDLTGDDVIEMEGVELDDLDIDIDAIVNDAEIRARIAEAMAKVRGAMPQANAALAAAGMQGFSWSSVDGTDAQVEMEKDAAFFGIGTEPVSPQTAAQLPLVRGTGLVVTMVEPESPAAKAGLAPLDVIARLGDQMVVNAEQFAVLVRSRKPGDAVEVTFLRGGKEQKATVTLAGKELPKLGPGGRRMVTGFLAEPTTLGSMDEDVLLVAPGVPGAPGAGPRPRVMTFTPGSRNDADFNVRVDRTRKGAKAGQNVASTTTQVRTMRFSDEEASVEWVVTGDETRFEITDRKGGAGWTGTGTPDEAALATLRPEVAASVRGFLESQSRMQDAIPAVPVPPVPPVPPVAPVAPAPRAISANGA
jgi:hypothetical protein